MQQADQHPGKNPLRRSLSALFLIPALASVLAAADLSTEAALRTAILQGSGSHTLTADVKLSADLPALPAGSRFNLDGRNHGINGDAKYALFQCPNDSTVLTLENLTLKNGFTTEHGAAVSSGRGLIVKRDIPGYGPVPILIDGSRNNRVILRNCILKDNISAKSGGAVFVHLEGEPGAPYLLIENCALIGNGVLKGPGIPTFKVNAEYNNGGAIWERVQSYQSDIIITNTTLSGNYAPELGGAILIGESAGPTGEAMAVKISHSTIVDNDCGLAGGAFWHDHSLLLDHSIVYGNTVGKSAFANGSDFAGPGPSLTLRWSRIGNRADENGLPIEQRCQGPVKGFAAILENNLPDADPQLSRQPVFLPARPATGPAYSTYAHVFDTLSPLYNAGDPRLQAGQGSTPAWDQRGDPRKRIENGRIDIGAFEYDAPLAVPESIPPLPRPAFLEAHLPGLLSSLPMAPPFPLANPVLLAESGPSGACLTCAGPKDDLAFRHLSTENAVTGFQPFLISLRANVPFRYRLGFFTTRGEFINSASGNLDAAALGSLRKDEEGNATLKLFWWPVSRDGAQAATGAYIVRGTIRAETGVDTLANPVIDISRIFGYLRR